MSAAPTGRAPRQKPAPDPADPPLPPPVATKISSTIANQNGDNQSQQQKTTQGGVAEDPRGTLPSSQATSQWATHAKDSPKLKETIRDLQRFLNALPFPVINITPTIAARIVSRALASQNVMPTAVAFDCALLFWRMIINVFFRSIQPRGAWRIPRPHEGPVIFVGAPHHNQFLDPLLLASEVRRGSGRRVAFLIAEKSIKRRFIGAAARLMQSIPVARAADSAKPGKGSITQHPSGDPCLLQGHSSQFTKQLVPRGHITLPKSAGYASAEVVDVISDTEVRVKKEFKDQKALDALSGKLPAGSMDDKEGGKAEGLPGCQYKCLPYVDQTQMYASVYECLARGGNLGIFPEGGSHDRTDLLPLKAGVVIMALGAMSANPGLSVRIVPVGLSYFHPHKFRSRAVVEFGAPMEVPRELVGLFDQGGEGKRKAVGEMMDIVYDGLKSVTVRAPDYDTLMFIQAGRRLYTPPGSHPTLSQVVELNRQFIIGYQKHKDEPRVIALKDDILRYNKMLTYAGLRDHQVERATRAGWRSLGLLGYRLFLLSFWGGLALPGVIINAPIILLAKFISRKKAKEALAASQVKVAGRDVVATWKVLVSMGFTPILYVIYAIFATVMAHKYKLTARNQVFMPIYILTILPTIAYSTLKFSEVGLDIYKSLPPLFVSLMPGNYKVIKELQETRARISSALHILIEELGPQTFSDFEQKRIFSQPNARAPPAPPTPGREDSIIWKEKSKNEGESYLSHPLTWADERLFGWKAERRMSRDARNPRTYSSSQDSRTLVEPSEEQKDKFGSADEGSGSDVSEQSEEEGDYEAIFSMLNPAKMLGLSDSAKSPRSPRSPRHARSRSGSGAGSFKDKRNRSGSDLKSLSSASMNTTPSKGGMPPALSPTTGRTSATDVSSGGGNSRSSNAGGAAGGGPTQRRQRKRSLAEDVQASDIALGAREDHLHERSFGDAGKALEERVQAQRSGNSNGSGGDDAAKAIPRLQDMREADSAPSTTPGTPTRAATGTDCSNS